MYVSKLGPIYFRKMTPNVKSTKIQHKLKTNIYHKNKDRSSSPSLSDLHLTKIDHLAGLTQFQRVVSVYATLSCALEAYGSPKTTGDEESPASTYDRNT